MLYQTCTIGNTYFETTSISHWSHYLCMCSCLPRQSIPSTFHWPFLAQPSHYICFTKETRDEIIAWNTFIKKFNGKSVFCKDHWFSSEMFSPQTNSAGSLGFACVMGKGWFDIKWNYGVNIQNNKVIILLDNLAVVEIIYKSLQR
jgi:hypothetical protein